jgi:hypothetical protein
MQTDKTQQQTIDWLNNSDDSTTRQFIKTHPNVWIEQLIQNSNYKYVMENMKK